MIQKYCTPENFVKLVEALTFYGDPDTYFAVGIFGDSPCGEFVNDIDEVVFVDEDDNEVDRVSKPGKLARTTISSIFSDQYHHPMIDLT